MRSAGLEAPFVGRNRELQLVKDLFHASAEERRAQLVLVSGVAGIGKSRLAWEFEKYIDGLVADTYWHRGRALYGEGVAYWALAEMVRQRCGIGEDEDAASAGERLTSTLEEHLPDPEERAWVRPRVAHCSGSKTASRATRKTSSPRGASSSSASPSRPRLFSSSRTCSGPTRACSTSSSTCSTGRAASRCTSMRSLAPSSPKSARPGRQARLHPALPRAAAGAGDERAATGLVPGLPEDLRERVLERAEGVPLYAVERSACCSTVACDTRRRGLPSDRTDRAAGDAGNAQAPVAARLDGLAPEERSLVQDGAVLGKTFTKQGLTALTGSVRSISSPSWPRCSGRRCCRCRPTRSRPSAATMFLRTRQAGRQRATSRRERKAKQLATADHLLRCPGARRTRSSTWSASTSSTRSSWPRMRPTRRVPTGLAPCVRAGERAASSLRARRPNGRSSGRRI